MFKSINKSSGQASRLLLVLAVVVLVAVIITFLVMKMAEKPAKPVDQTPASTVVLPVYEKTLGNIKFIFLSSIDKGSALKVSDIVNKQFASSVQKNLVVSNPGAKFVQVTVGAQNEGTVNTDQNAWTIENIVDSEGRNFIPLESSYEISPWLPSPDLCGALLKPAFDPTPCVKIYEVSKESTGLKIRVETGKGNTSQNFSSGKVDSYLIDLIVNK